MPDVATQLYAQELTIQRGMATFVEVGVALEVIRANRLYRTSGYATFEQYCQVRWGWTRQHANRVIGAAGVVTNLEPMGSILPNERQARELAALPPEQQRAVWAEVTSTDAPPTAARVRQAIPKLKGKKQRGPKGLYGHLTSITVAVEAINAAFDDAGDDALAYLSSDDRRQMERTITRAADFVEKFSELLSRPVSRPADDWGA